MQPWAEKNRPVGEPRMGESEADWTGNGVGTFGGSCYRDDGVNLAMDPYEFIVSRCGLEHKSRRK